MTTLDLRSVPRDDHRERIFEALDDAAVGETVSIVADRDPNVTLHHYRIKRGQHLRWESRRSDDAPELRVEKGEPLDDGEFPAFDVREMAPQRRHEVLTDTFDRLDPDEGFVLVNDHDPKPLYHELRSTRGDGFEWEYLSRGSQEYRVEIVKTGETATTDDEVPASFDVRDIPKAERHPTIHHRYANIADGETMEIVAPQEPRSLRQEFQQRYGDAFSWEVVERQPLRWRIRITKRGETSESGADGSELSTDDASTATATSDSLAVTRELDVRDRPPAERHERIFDAYAGLESGEAFVLVNDHDPKPLYHQFDAEAGEEFHWEYRNKEPGEFRVLVGKLGAADTETDPTETPDAPF